MPSRKPTSSRGGHSKAFKAITKLARFEHALTRQPVQTSSSSSSSSETTSEEEPSPAPWRRPEASTLPMRRLAPLYFYKTKSFSTGRKLPVPAKGTAARASEPKIGGRVQRATVVDRDSGGISRQRVAKKDYRDPKWPCCECGDERCSQMVAQGSGRCTKCFGKMRYNKYVKKQTALGLTSVDEMLYFLTPK